MEQRHKEEEEEEEEQQQQQQQEQRQQQQQQQHQEQQEEMEIHNSILEMRQELNDVKCLNQSYHMLYEAKCLEVTLWHLQFSHVLDLVLCDLCMEEKACPKKFFVANHVIEMDCVILSESF